MFKKLLKYLAVFSACMVLVLAGFYFMVSHYGEKMALSFVNNDLPRMLNKKVMASNVKISMVTGEIRLDNPGLLDLPVISKNVSVAADKMSIYLDLVQLLRKNIVVKNIVLVSPKIHVDLSDRAIIPAGPAAKTSGSGGFFPEIQINNFQVKNGTLVLALIEKNTYYLVEKVSFNIKNPFSSGKLPVVMELEGKFESQENSLIKTNFTFGDCSTKMNFKGTLEIEGVQASSFYSLLNSKQETIVNSGTIDIRSTFHCADDWVTASNIVTLDKLDIITSEKKLFGIETEVVTGFFKSNDVSFDLPVIGNIHSLKFGFSTAATQVLMKALQERLKDEDFRNKIADKMGRKIGGKLEESMAELFYNKK
ncbi:MAG: hypothetical protein A2297_06095 [Elusimicrobia bacterium RIFOXYB2_FULL_48_7]|nr:MAG: hypothetical protein A2297_06095 [Elusimicrobia bacterium RIFOXYB2_FULL_48_7]